MMEEQRQRRYNTFAVRIQRAYRRWKSRKYFIDLRAMCPWPRCSPAPARASTRMLMQRHDVCICGAPQRKMSCLARKSASVSVCGASTLATILASSTMPLCAHSWVRPLRSMRHPTALGRRSHSTRCYAMSLPPISRQDNPSDLCRQCDQVRPAIQAAAADAAGDRDAGQHYRVREGDRRAAKGQGGTRVQAPNQYFGHQDHQRQVGGRRPTHARTQTQARAICRD
jgi:hypothetical protein